MIPTSMNNVALNSAWAMVWSIAAARAIGVPTPMAATSSPSWLTVEWARMAFRSCWRRAMKAPHNAEVNPIETRSADHAGTPEKMGETSISRYRSAERRVGKECDSTCRYRGSTYHGKTKKEIENQTSLTLLHIKTRNT